jgi:3-hydroxyisobutyrate dehydrogenase/glyoxylate/succinic semialdehyde reductase
MAMKVGFIGLGIMGSRMAANLRAHGYEVVVFNRTPDKADALVRDGASRGTSPRAAAAEADVLFTMLADPEAVTAAALGADGFLNALRPGSMWVNCSSVNPSFARRMAEDAGARRVRYVDAPVTGSKHVAAHGELMFLVGADPADLEVCRPLLLSMGTHLVHIGGVGLGSAMKMVNNLLLAIAMDAFAEGAALGQALGIPRQVIFDTLLGGPIVPPFLALKRARIDADDYGDADFSLRWIQKDLHLASVTGYEAGVAMPVANVTKEIYRLAMREGLADQDFSAIYTFLNDDARTRSGQLPPQVASPISS